MNNPNKKQHIGLFSLYFRTKKLMDYKVVSALPVLDRVKILHQHGVAHGDIGNNVMCRNNGEPVFINYDHNIIIAESPGEEEDHFDIINYGQCVEEYYC